MFEDVLQREIDRHLINLERKSLDVAPSGLGSSPASPTEASQVLTVGLPSQDKEDLRRLAAQMSANLLHRLAKHSSEWDQDAATPWDEERKSSAGTSKAFGRGRRRSEAVLRLEEQVRELEGRLQQKRQEIVGHQEELIAKCKTEFASVLNAKEQEILDVQKSVGFDEAAAPHGSASGHAEAARRDFTEHVRLTQRSLEEARSALAAVESKRRGLDRVEAMQKRAPYSAVEELLTKCGPRGLEESPEGEAPQDDADEECQQLWEAILRGEQVAKKLRRAVSGA